MKELPIILDIFSGLMAKIRRAFTQLSLEGRSREKRLFLVAYASFYANISASLTILRSGEYSSLPLVFRPALEAYVDILNMRDDPKYAAKIICCLNKERLKYLKEMRSLKKGTSGQDNEIESLERLVSTYSNDDVKRITKKEKFTTAGLPEYYVAVYGMMSGHAHNDYNFTISDSVDTKGNFFESYAGSLRVHEVLAAYVALICESLYNCTRELAASVTEYDVEMYDLFCKEILELQEYILSTSPVNGESCGSMKEGA